MAKAAISARISESEAQAVDRYCKQRGCSKSALFRSAVLAAIGAKDGDGPLQGEELDSVIGMAARGGSVSAMRLAHDREQAQAVPEQSRDIVDELAARRAS